MLCAVPGEGGRRRPRRSRRGSGRPESPERQRSATARHPFCPRGEPAASCRPSGTGGPGSRRRWRPPMARAARRPGAPREVEASTAVVPPAEAACHCWRRRRGLRWRRGWRLGGDGGAGRVRKGRRPGAGARVGQTAVAHAGVAPVSPPSITPTRYRPPPRLRWRPEAMRQRHVGRRIAWCGDSAQPRSAPAAPPAPEARAGAPGQGRNRRSSMSSSSWWYGGHLLAP